MSSANGVVVEGATRVEVVDVVANVREEDDPVPVAEEGGADGTREVAFFVAQDEDDALAFRGLRVAFFFFFVTSSENLANSAGFANSGDGDAC